MISFDAAYRLTLDAICPLDSELVSLAEATDRVTAEDLGAWD